MPAYFRRGNTNRFMVSASWWATQKVIPVNRPHYHYYIVLSAFRAIFQSHDYDGLLLLGWGLVRRRWNMGWESASFHFPPCSSLLLLEDPQLRERWHNCRLRNERPPLLCEQQGESKCHTTTTNQITNHTSAPPRASYFLIIPAGCQTVR